MAEKSKLQMSLDEVAQHYQVDSRPSRRGRGSGIRKNAPLRADTSRGGGDDVTMRDAGASGSGGAWYRGGGRGFRGGGGRFPRRGGRNDWNGSGGSPAGAWRPRGGSAWGGPERRRGAYGGYSSTPPGCFVKVEGLEYSVMEQDLREAFETVGEVTSVWVDYDQTDRSEGTGGAIFAVPEEARRAVQTFNGRLLDGKRLKLSVGGGPQRHHSGSWGERW